MTQAGDKRDGLAGPEKSQGETGAAKLTLIQALSGQPEDLESEAQLIAALRLLPRAIAQRLIVVQVGGAVSAIWWIHGCLVSAYSAVPSIALPGAYSGAQYSIVWSYGESALQAADDSLTFGVPILTHAASPCARLGVEAPSLVTTQGTPQGLADLIVAVARRGGEGGASAFRRAGSW